MFDGEVGGQIGWLLPAALRAARRRPVVDPARAAHRPLARPRSLWGGWLLVTGLIFSFMAGIFHAYYTVALAPAIARSSASAHGCSGASASCRWPPQPARVAVAACRLVQRRLLGRSRRLPPVAALGRPRRRRLAAGGRARRACAGDAGSRRLAPLVAGRGGRWPDRRRTPCRPRPPPTPARSPPPAPRSPVRRPGGCPTADSAGRRTRRRTGHAGQHPAAGAGGMTPPGHYRRHPGGNGPGWRAGGGGRPGGWAASPGQRRRAPR